MNHGEKPVARQRDFKSEIKNGRTWWSIVCPECNGEGCSSCYYGGVKILQICHHCHGNGSEDCQCQGSGVLPADSDFYNPTRHW